MSRAAKLGWLNVQGTPFAFLHYTVSPIIFSVLAIGELGTTSYPKHQAAKLQRLLRFASSWELLAEQRSVLFRQNLLLGLILGAIGAVVGTLGGYEARLRLARAFGGKDLPVALLEDLIAIASGFLIVSQAS